MKTLVMIAATVLLAAGSALAQENSGGTINSLTVNPTENQELSGNVATTTGQPNDVTPKSVDMPNGLVPQTVNMTGSGSNGNMAQPVAAAKPGSSATQQNRQASGAAKSGPAKKSAANPRK